MPKPKRNSSIDVKKLPILNELDVRYAPDYPLFHFQFGAYGTTNIMIWGGPGMGLEDALEEAAGYLADHAPGHIYKHGDPHLQELIDEVLEEKGKTRAQWEQGLEDQSQWAYDIEQEAFADLTQTESGYLTSYEWYVNELGPGDELFGKVFEATVDRELENLDDRDIEKMNKVAKAAGLSVQWEPFEGDTTQNPAGRGADYSLDELADLFDLPEWDDVEEANSDRIAEMVSGIEDEDERLEQEQAEQEELYRTYKNAVEAGATHDLLALGLDLREKKNGKFEVFPEKSWNDAAAKLTELVNGIGMFHFSSLKEFLSSGPYTARQAVLSHLFYAKRYAEVYGGSDAEDLYERNFR